MKRCPECRRDYYDDSLLYCLDDGNALLEGPASMDEPKTAILHSTAAPDDAPTRAQIYTTDKTAVLPSGIADVPKTRVFDKRLLLAPLVLSKLSVVFLGTDISSLPLQNRSIRSQFCRFKIRAATRIRITYPTVWPNRLSTGFRRFPSLR
jgi:hypothetical protein